LLAGSLLGAVRRVSQPSSQSASRAILAAVVVLILILLSNFGFASRRNRRAGSRLYPLSTCPEYHENFGLSLAKTWGEGAVVFHFYFYFRAGTGEGACPSVQ